MEPLIVRLANLSFTSGVFPSRYKAGQVTPLLKKPSLSADDPANYRPITNLHTFSKILEHFSSRSFSVSSPSVWNSLPAHVRSIDNLCTFKRHLKSHLFQSAFTA